MLPKKRRVNKELFELIMKKGLIISGQFFVFRYLPPGVKHLGLHLACVAPKSVAKKAVNRNKLRRRAYSILRSFPVLKGSGIFFYKKTGVLVSSNEIKKDIEFLLKKAHFI